MSKAEMTKERVEELIAVVERSTEHLICPDDRADLLTVLCDKLNAAALRAAAEPDAEDEQGTDADLEQEKKS